MMCTECDKYMTECWNWMRDHYKIFHQEIKRPDKLFKKEVRHKQ